MNIVNLNEFWIHEYMADSYLTHLSISQLSGRARYLIENITTLELDGKIGLKDIKHEPARSLMQKYIHVLQEFKIRNEEPDPMYLKGASIPKAMSGKGRRLTELNNKAIEKRPHLVKFGNKMFLEKHSFKISLASSSNDPSLNTARMDDEMKSVYNPHPKDIKLTHLDGRIIEGVKNVQLAYEVIDYYFFCSSHIFDVRIFGDFGYDACLFIYDSQKFSDDMHTCVTKKVSIEDHGYKQVTYVDPIRPELGSPPPVEFHKHIKFLYQNEYRHIFIPEKGSTQPKDLYISMPESSGYTELFCL